MQGVFKVLEVTLQITKKTLSQLMLTTLNL